MMTWSAGMTNSTGSDSFLAANSAANVRAGAVLRPTGSSTMVPGVPIKRNCSAITKRYSSLLTTTGAASSTPLMPCTRRTVACSSESSPISGSSCFGYFSRDSGHRRVPEPPDKTMGWMSILNWVGWTVATRQSASGAGIAPAQLGSVVAPVQSFTVAVNAVLG